MESVDDYLTQLASEWPTPGGGSAATMVGAAGAALVAMVARINSANPKYAPQAALAHDLVRRADALRAEFLKARVRDEAAFDRVVAATAMPKGTDAEKAARRDVLEIALHHAAAEPLLAAQSALDVLRLCAQSLEIPNKNLVSDVGCAAEFAAAALAACAYNVRINHRFMKDRDAIEAQEHALARYERESSALLHAIRRSIDEMVKA
ncbi:MAG: cyclodeaminase/cyclohydrolase family protein [bacterium]|nr:cyclodeaminase/cyclohydrolase family protein [bacterium]